MHESANESADESAYVPLSALQHYAFCPRQCALIHVERIWMDNAHTAEGSLMHEKAHSGAVENRGELRAATGLPLCSARLGVSGQADVVEFRREGKTWRPYPVEYKKGHPHRGCDADLVQLCAQALCLEEMLGGEVPGGALFYGQPRRRTLVAFTPELRARTEEVARQVHDLFTTGTTPRADPAWAASRRCEACSLHDWCLPLAGQASTYLEELRNREAP